MPFRIASVSLRDFRNYRDMELENLGQIVVFAGPNATGKTNLVEGMQLLTALESFRNPKTNELIGWGREKAKLSAQLVDDERTLDVALLLDARGRHYYKNGKQRPRLELQGVLPAVFFSPDDLQLVKGAPDIRRRAIDVLGSQVSRNYAAVKRDYDRLLRQKNRLLKDEASENYLASVNELLVRIGGQLFRYRMHILKTLREVLPVQHDQITAHAGVLSLECTPSFQDEPLNDELIAAYEDDREKVENALQEALERRHQEEHRRQTSLVGPHRDKFSFALDARAAADFASQGQQRSIAIAYKLAELEMIERMTHVKPVLFLDDVMSELDENRRARLVENLQSAAQTFITTTNLDYFHADFLERAQIISLPFK